MMSFFILFALKFAFILLFSLVVYISYSVTKNLLITTAIYYSIGGYLFFLTQGFFLSVLFTVLIGLLIEKVTFFYLRRRCINPLSILVASLGIYLIFQNLISLYFGDDIQILISGEISVGQKFYGAYITSVQIMTIICSALIFLGMYILYNYTFLGKQIRSVSENANLSDIYGISNNKITLIATAISSAIAAIAGILYAYDTNLTPTIGFNLLLYGIVAMIIGGVGSFRGLLFGSLLLATAQNLVAYYLDTKWMDAATYIILIGFLIWKPLGFSGKRLKKVEI